MSIPFFKYQGTGNDFVMIDNRAGVYGAATPERNRLLCDRRFGIGADGLILLQNHPDYDFEMVYFNSDGNESTMCGNGGRCIVAFANMLGIVGDGCRFLAIDGPHDARIADDLVELKMGDVQMIERIGEDFWLDTGSPHYVTTVASVEQTDIVALGKSIRYNERFKAEGTNVNAVERVGVGHIAVRTYERGVEDETLSCGTGVTAAAICAHQLGWTNADETTKVDVQGGQLSIKLNPAGTGYQNLWLIGPATQVFKGTIDG